VNPVSARPLAVATMSSTVLDGSMAKIAVFSISS
jgi:hypothetical protein